ncbi:MAG: prepilin-type N-terminal cleavage/methylation domain-containing protein [Tissierellia bacterium]|nr:prepilin-type N-terminal cleavage/methylation domain-containing protein [Tissierellia bacterium]
MKKGFTLIELLAVIVILAIIALIASPIVVGLIEDSNRQAAERSTEAVVNAAKTRYALSQMNPTEYSLVTDASLIDVDNPPTSGTIAYGTTGQITLSNVIIGNYSCAYTAAAKATCTKQ